MSKKGQLYSDDNPETTLPGTGFKDTKTVEKTLKLIKNRSNKFQKSVMITMYYRAKHHPHQTEDMKKAMVMIKKWLDKNKKEIRKYPYLDLDIIKKYEKLADIYDISRTARGLEKSKKSDEGFLEVYKRVGGKYGKLAFIPIFKKNPSKGDYDILREKFLNARIGQMKHAKVPLYYADGPYEGLPTKQHLVMIMNGYSPDPSGLKKKVKLVNNLSK
jgi:hypothetical protein